MKKKLRLGVVGMGSRGRTMFRCAVLFDCIIPAAVCEVRPENWFEDKWGKVALAKEYPDTAFYDDYDKMLDEANLDIVFVETGADIHAEFIMKALKKNINVLTDIPVVANLKEAEDLWRVAQESTAMLSVGANPNHQKFTDYLIDFHKKGLLGKPYYMEAEYIHWFMPGSDVHTRLNENGDWRKLLVSVYYCTHSLGPLLTVLDEPLRKVSCFGTGEHADPSEYTPGIIKHDMSCAQFQTESGVVVRFLKNGRCRADIGHHNYRVFGTEGYIERIDRLGKPVIRYNSMKELDTGLKEVDGSFMPKKFEDNEIAWKAGHDGMDFAMLDRLFKAMLNGDPAPVSLKEGLEMTLPGLYAGESIKRGGEVLTIRYPWEKEWTGKFE